MSLIQSFVVAFRAVRNGRQALIQVQSERDDVQLRFEIDANKDSRILLTELQAVDLADQILALVRQRRDARDGTLSQAALDRQIHQEALSAMASTVTPECGHTDARGFMCMRPLGHTGRCSGRH